VSGNTAASIRARLLVLAKDRSEDFNFILTLYAIQRLLYRLSVSEFRDQFLLKGAWLFSIWSEELHRPTKDADFLGFGDNDVDTLVNTFKSICSVPVDDGLDFDLESMKGIEIKEDAIYQGVRITGYAYLAKARIALQLDIAFGDVVTPQAETARLPVYLDLPAPELKVYPVYTVIAEKFQAMVVLGIANSRMKDFYDIWRIAGLMPIEGQLLLQAIKATFARRGTKIGGEAPLIFSEEFSTDINKQTQWNAFLKKNELKGNAFDQIMIDLLGFIQPVYNAAAENKDWRQSWKPDSREWVDTKD